MNEDEGRRQLAELVQRLRTERFRTVTRATAEAQVSRGSWDAVERGDRVKPQTLAAVEQVFGWYTGRAQAIIEGRDNRGDSSLRDEVLASDLSDEAKASVLAAIDRALTPPPASPAPGERGAS